MVPGKSGLVPVVVGLAVAPCSVHIVDEGQPNKDDHEKRYHGKIPVMGEGKEGQ